MPTLTLPIRAYKNPELMLLNEHWYQKDRRHQMKEAHRVQLQYKPRYDANDNVEYVPEMLAELMAINSVEKKADQALTLYMQARFKGFRVFRHDKNRTKSETLTQIADELRSEHEETDKAIYKHVKTYVNLIWTKNSNVSSI